MASLAPIHSGDIVEVNVRGRRALAFARTQQNRTLHIEPITPGFTYRTVSGRQVERHWRLTKNRRPTND